MGFLGFLRDNARWLAGGFLMTLCSGFGQTYFVSLSGGAIRAEYGLSHGAFAALNTAATLIAGMSLIKLGVLVDRFTVRAIAVGLLPMVALGALVMALSHHIVLLLLALILLRLFGQGMLVHTAFTSVGRWFSAQRGRAASVVTLGLNIAEGTLPLIFVAGAAMLGWRNVWFLVAAILVLAALPAIAALLAVERQPQSSVLGAKPPAPRDWTADEVRRDPIFYLMLLGTLPLSFIGNSIFFHQVHFVETRGWPIELFASAFLAEAGLTFVFAVIGGQTIDRLSAARLLPFYLLPMALGGLLLGFVTAPWAAFGFMALFGVSNGYSLAIYGTLWPEVYGIRHLGAIRAMLAAAIAFTGALAPGVMGVLIDLGVPMAWQIVAMSLACIAISLVMIRVARAIAVRRADST